MDFVNSEIVLNSILSSCRQHATKLSFILNRDAVCDNNPKRNLMKPVRLTAFCLLRLARLENLFS